MSLSRLFPIFISTLLIAGQVPAKTRKPIEKKVIDILSKPKKFEGQTMQINGCLTVQFENDVVYDDDEVNCKNGIDSTMKGIFVLIPKNSQLRDVNPMKSKKYKVSIIGKFRSKPFDNPNAILENVKVLTQEEIKESK